MKRIEYVIGYGDGQETLVSVYARNIGSGFRKVAKNADKNIPASWGDVAYIKFWMVTS